ncbi:hypothetical protein DPMN_141760 [Dreissena polymorpha]|uniref:Uncharacterized protein n=1 Tax=Dreissena polymorpha TaxID=45954 RepID=A0A9D4JIL3_DREPO|nr:hypothetical protein DPMN_141760 [Dreissena polymorpha]
MRRRVACVITCGACVITCGACVITCEAYVITCGACVIMCVACVITCGACVITCGAYVIMCVAGYPDEIMALIVLFFITHAMNMKSRGDKVSEGEDRASLCSQMEQDFHNPGSD